MRRCILRSLELESPPHQFLEGRQLRVGWGAQRDEPALLSTPLEEPAPVVQLAATVEVEGRMPGEGPDSEDGRAVHGVEEELPHVSWGTRGPAHWKEGRSHSAPSGRQ